MNVKRILSMITVWVLCMVLSQVNAQKSMSVLNTYLQHDVTVDGAKGMMVHGTLKVDGYKNRNMKLTAYIYQSPGKMIEDRNGKFCSSNGKVASSMDFYPESDSELYGSISIFFPYNEMHLNEGTHTYYCRLHLIDPENLRVKGEYMPFERTIEPQKRELQVLKTNIEQGDNGMKVRVELKALGYENRELQLTAKFFDSNKQPLKSDSVYSDVEKIKVIKPRSNEEYRISEYIYVPYSVLPLNVGANTYYCRVSLSDSESTYTVGDYVSFEVTGSTTKMIDVWDTWIEHGVTHNGKQGLKVHSNIEVDGYGGEEVKYTLSLYDANKNSYKNPLGNQVLTATYDRSIWDDFWYFVSYDELNLKPGTHTYYMQVNVSAGDGRRATSDYVSFDGTGSTKKRVEVPKVWIEHGVTHNGKQGLKVHSRIEVDGYEGQEVKYIVSLYDANKNSYKNPLGNQVLTATYDRSIWDDFSYFVSYDDLDLKQGTHTYYMMVNALMDDGKRGISDYVSFDGTGPTNKSPAQHNHNHNHNAQNNIGGKLQQAPVYHGKREGSFYYVSETLQQGFFRFYYNNGYYMAEAPGMYNLYGHIVRYICVDESAEYYLFKQAKVHLNGTLEFLDYASKMKVSKAWNKIICEGIALDRSDIVYVKEVSEQEYNEISSHKNAYIYGGGNNGGNNNGTSLDMSPNNSHVDKACGYCGGGGGCSSCNGTGLKYNPWGGGYDTCPSCNGSGRCFNCRGTGKQSTW